MIVGCEYSELGCPCSPGTQNTFLHLYSLSLAKLQIKKYQLVVLTGFLSPLGDDRLFGILWCKDQIKFEIQSSAA